MLVRVVIYNDNTLQQKMAGAEVGEASIEYVWPLIHVYLFHTSH